MAHNYAPNPSGYLPQPRPPVLSNHDRPQISSTPVKKVAVDKKKSVMKLSSPQTMVTILVGNGDSPAKFVVHKDFACHYSPIFRVAFNNVFIEGQTQTYRLKDCRTEVVSLLVEWIYTKDTSSSKDSDGYDNLIDLWILADKLFIPELQNQIITKLQSMHYIHQDKALLLGHINKIYAGTMRGSKLRNYVVAQYAYRIKPCDIKTVSRQFSRVFLVDYANYFYGKLGPFKSVTWNIHVPNYYVGEKKP